MMPVKRDGLGALRVHHECESRRSRTQSSEGSVGKQCRAQTASMKPPIDRQPAYPDRGDARIARQLFRQFGGKIWCWNAARGQRVEGRDLVAGGLDSHKTIRDFPADVLGDLALEVAVEGLLAARESRPVVRFSQRFKTEWNAHAPNNSRCRRATRLKAALGAGGLRIALAKSF